MASKKISEMTPAEQEIQRAKWRLEIKGRRKRKKQQGKLFEDKKPIKVKKANEPKKEKLSAYEKLEKKRASNRNWYYNTKDKTLKKQAEYHKEKKKKKTEEFMKNFKAKYG